MEDLSMITIERGLKHSYMIIRGGEVEPVDYQVKMLVNNQIPCLLKLNIHMIDGHYDYYYDISSRQDLYSAFEGKQMDHMVIKDILENVLKAYDMTREYMLDEAYLVLDPRYIYVCPETMNMEFLFYSIKADTIENQFQILSEYILDRADHTDAEAVRLAYDLFKLIKTHNFTFSAIEELISTESKGKSDANLGLDTSMGASKGVDIEGPGTELSTNVLPSDDNHVDYKDIKDNLLKMISPKKDKGKDLNEIMVIDEPKVHGQKHELIRKGNSKEQTIYIYEYPVTIGSNKGQSDIYIKDGSISASHIRIYQNKDAIYLQNIARDRQTYINEMLLEKDESILLESGDNIRLGKLKYEFK